MKESSSPTQRRPARHFLLAAACGAVCVLLLTSSMGASPSYATEQAVGHQAAPQKVQARAFAGQARPQPQWGPNWKASQSKRGGKYVVTSVMGLDPERLNIFVKSLRRHSPDTHLVVFVEENTTHHLLEDNGAEVIPFKMDENSALVLYRFELYKRYLGELLLRDSEAGVILTDSRDVLIQSDPFKEPLVQRLINEDSMLFSLEGGIAVGEVPLKAQPQNEHWIDTCFGPEMVKEMADAPISCAGITIGSVAAVHGYVTQLLATAYQDASSKCRKYGSDQAVHNYLLHYLGPRGRLTFPYLMRRNWDSPVHTAGYGWPIVIDRDGVYKRVNGSTPPIVHQYDRAFDATKIYMAMYPLREEEYRWEGPDCVKNLFLDTVNQCPPDAKAADAAAKAKQQPKAADQAAEDEEEEERQRQEQGKDAAAEVADPGDGGGDVRR